MRAIRSLGSLLLLAALPAFQGGDRPDRPDRPDRDPPSRVGRLSYLSGPVSFRPGDVDDWTDATINYPLHNGDHPWTDSDARAEVTVGWCASRDRRWDGARSSRYVSRDVIGYEDLDDNGEWRTTPDYGPVWVPRTVATGWAPYRYGHWAWVEPWGWTWIDDAPWGFAPFHYGRWVYVGDGWAWVPGRVVTRPVYAPALVVFVGGRNWSVAIGAGGGGGVAWFPLAPEEPYYPAYHVSNTYVRNVNVTNVNVTNINVTNVNVTNINFRNRRAPDAVTVVSHDAFVQH